MMPNFPSLKMRSFGHSLKGKRQKVPHFLLLFFFAKINQIYLHFLLGLERYKRSGAYKCSGALQMLRSSTRAPEGLKYRSSGSGYSWAPLRSAEQKFLRLRSSTPAGAKNALCSAPGALRLRSAPQHCFIHACHCSSLVKVDN